MLKREAHLNKSRIQVDIRPVKRQQFTPSHARCQRQNIQRFEWAVYPRRQQDTRLLRGQDLHLLVRRTQRLDQRNNIALNDTYTCRLTKCATQNGMNTRHCPRSQATSELSCVERLYLLR